MKQKNNIKQLKKGNKTMKAIVWTLVTIGMVMTGHFIVAAIAGMIAIRAWKKGGKRV
jgi:hypothetical protein